MKKKNELYDHRTSWEKQIAHLHKIVAILTVALILVLGALAAVLITDFSIYGPNLPKGQAVTLNAGTYTAGKEFYPGVYSIRASKGDVALIMLYKNREALNRDEHYDAYSVNAVESIEDKEVGRVEIPAGTVVHTSGAIVLTPYGT